MRRWTIYILAAVAAWLALLGLICAMPVLSGVMTWKRSLEDTVVQWLPWALLSPIIFWVALRMPSEKLSVGWRMLFHLVSGIISVVFAAWVSSYCLAPQILTAPPMDHEGPDGGPPDMVLNENQFGTNSIALHLFRDRHHHEPPVWARASFNVPIYLTLISLSYAFVYFRRSQQRERHAIALESQLDLARLQALRMQLQPHFLFNTLNAISTLVQTNPGVAHEMIGSLGQMLRLSLDNCSELEVPLEQELEFLDSYLEIAQIRFGDRLQVKRSISPETLAALVPTFILQPLAENAVQHGIEPASSQGTIEISATSAAGRLMLSVSDTGVGLAETTDVTKSNGIGLANTKARLQSLYPGQHKFSVQNRPEGGCMVALEIPFHSAPLAGEAKATR